MTSDRNSTVGHTQLGDERRIVCDGVARKGWEATYPAMRGAVRNISAVVGRDKAGAESVWQKKRAKMKSLVSRNRELLARDLMLSQTSA